MLAAVKTRLQDCEAILANSRAGLALRHRSGAFAKVLRRVLEAYATKENKSKACAEQKLRKSFRIRCLAVQARIR
nr:hypothetical protein [uncultured Campylobacter sp.]